MKNSIYVSLWQELMLILSSCSTNYYSDADFNKVKKYDTHIHCNSENTVFGDQAKADNFSLLYVNDDVPGLLPVDK